jgi:hypothetical protein
MYYLLIDFTFLFLDFHIKANFDTRYFSSNNLDNNLNKEIKRKKSIYKKMVKFNETYRKIKMNKSFKKAIRNIMNTSDITEYRLINDETEYFEPKLTSSPFKKQSNLSTISTSTKSSQVHYYGENNLELSVSKAYLESTTATVSNGLKYKKSLVNNVEKRRGGYKMLSNNYLNEFGGCGDLIQLDNRSNEELGYDTLINSNSNNPFIQPSKVFDTLQSDTMPSESLFQSFTTKLQQKYNKYSDFYINQKLNFEFGKFIFYLVVI